MAQGYQKSRRRPTAQLSPISNDKVYRSHKIRVEMTNPQEICSRAAGFGRPSAILSNGCRRFGSWARPVATNPALANQPAQTQPMRACVHTYGANVLGRGRRRGWRSGCTPCGTWTFRGRGRWWVVPRAQGWGRWWGRGRRRPSHPLVPSAEEVPCELLQRGVLHDGYQGGG